ncbi:hypothetical protein Mal15_14760 [Stieleria maiorica]|uniref:Uncharacterized protein n=1 Tax=Stieleria maiorica TaxID=2795974 RepID=A0A5B9MB17_9BACT|nr:hypothetical protein [Stieleria maiorica]QEF97436.1 hypothetical protein Mal15_14760 [Stieleria maiorica]
MPSSKADTSRSTESRNASSKSNSNDTAGDANEQIVTLDRRRPGAERRGGDPGALDVGVMKNPRRKKQRRRHIDPTTCERDYSDPEIEFMRAMDDYKRKSGRMFPTCSEVLEVVRDLGYFRLTEQQIDQLGLGDIDDEADAIDAEQDECDEAEADA